MNADSLISNFDFLARAFGIQAFNEHGERILSDNEIKKLVDIVLEESKEKESK